MYDVIPLLLFNATATDTASAVAEKSGHQDNLKLSHKIVHIGFIGVSSSDQEELYWPLIEPGNFPNLVSVSLCVETLDISKTLATLGRADLRRLRHLALAVYLDLIIDENGQMVDRPGGSLHPLLRHERPLASAQALDLSLVHALFARSTSMAQPWRFALIYARTLNYGLHHPFAFKT